MTSIHFLIETMYNQFRCNYLRNKKFFCNFFCIFETKLNFEHCEKKEDPDSLCIFEIADSEKRG